MRLNIAFSGVYVLYIQKKNAWNSMILYLVGVSYRMIYFSFSYIVIILFIIL